LLAKFRRLLSHLEEGDRGIGTFNGTEDGELEIDLMGPNVQPLAARSRLTFAHRFRCAAAIFLRAAADILRLLPFRVGIGFVKESSRRCRMRA